MDKYIYQDYQIGEEIEIFQLIKKVFDEFIAWEFTNEGIALFYDFIAPERIRNRIEKGNFVLTAKNKDRIIGIIEISDYSHICLLFVDKESQKEGVAKSLFNIALKRIKSDGKKAIIDVNSSTYSEKIYAKLGFVADNEIQNYAGIKYVPMSYEIRR